jgi:hypothetical protein
MSFTGLKELVDEAYLGGKHCCSTFRKIPGTASVQGQVVDFTMASGNPRPNYYTGDDLEAKLILPDRGIWTGGNVSPATKYLHKTTFLTTNAGVAPALFTLCDFLLFYPLIDMDSTSEQTLVTNVTLPRYTTGEGVRAFLVATNPYTGGGTFFIEYTNSNGETGRCSAITTSNTGTFIGTVVHSGPHVGSRGQFIDLAPGDLGIRKVDKITFTTMNGGLATLVLVKPLASVLVREVNVPCEWDFFLMKSALPIIYDGAVLNFIGSVNGSVASQIVQGDLTTIWN